MKYSKNVKLNKVLNEIENQLLEFGTKDIKVCMNIYPEELDYHIAMTGCLLAYYWEVRKMYTDAGYKTFEGNKISDSKMWNIYKRQVGYVARKLMNTATF